VLEERDIQVRGYQLRLPLDLLVVASANPEDYTNRGRIITPLKDRFGAEVRTHYPLELVDELELIAQEAAVLWDAPDGAPHAAPVVPTHLLEVVARFARDVRDAPQVDQRSGVSARFAIAAIETVAASAVRRAAIAGESLAVARVADLPAVIPACRGKVEFDDADEGREFEVLEHLLRRGINETFRAHLAGLDLRPLQGKFDDGLTVSTGDAVSADELLGQLGPVPVLSALLERLEPDGIGEGPAAVGIAAAVLEFALEGLHLNKRLAKDSDGSRTVYGH
jgi:magnesium chelatase subunit I